MKTQKEKDGRSEWKKSGTNKKIERKDESITEAETMKEQSRRVVK